MLFETIMNELGTELERECGNSGYRCRGGRDGRDGREPRCGERVSREESEHPYANIAFAAHPFFNIIEAATSQAQARAQAQAQARAKKEAVPESESAKTTTTTGTTGPTDATAEAKATKAASTPSSSSESVRNCRARRLDPTCKRPARVMGTRRLELLQKIKKQQKKKEKWQKCVPVKTPTVDYIETEKNYNIAVELPGVPKDVIKIELENGLLTVSTGEAADTLIVNDYNNNKTIDNNNISNTDSNNADVEMEMESDKDKDKDNTEDLSDADSFEQVQPTIKAKVTEPTITTTTTTTNLPDVDGFVESVADEENAFSEEDIAAEALAKSLNRDGQYDNGNATDADDDNNSSKNNIKLMYKHSERNIGTYKRSFKIDKEVQAESITASFTDGLLQLTIAKPIKKLPQRIAIM